MKDLTVPELFIILIQCEYLKTNDIGRLSVINEALAAQANVAWKSRPKEEIIEGLKTIAMIEPELGTAFKAMADLCNEISGI